MAMRMLSASRNLVNSFKTLSLGGGLNSCVSRVSKAQHAILRPPLPVIEAVRPISFLNKSTAEAIWKSCTSVSNAGRKRGRARRAGKGLTRDLNRGQVTGEGRKRLIMPGLNTMIRDGNRIEEPRRGNDDPEWKTKLYAVRDSTRHGKKGRRAHQVERGYSGRSLPGVSIGAPDPVGGYSFEGFDTRVIEFKIVNVMRGNLGRFRRHSSFVITGNGNGIVGFAMGKSTDPKAALRKAKKRAAQKLMNINLCDNRTVYHDFFCQFGDTKIYVSKKPPGYGIKTHRVIKTICQLTGIKDLHAKIEGATGVGHIVKAFFLGLLQQKTYAQLAEEKKLYLCEFRKDQNYFPNIVGIPSTCRTAQQIEKNEILDFRQHVMNGKVVLRKKKHPPFYSNYPSYKIYLRRAEKRRSHEPIKFDLYTRYGELRSFLADKHPEAKANYKRPAAAAEDE